MVVAEIESGFGNQLFNYACAYALARRLDAKLILDSMLLSTNTLRNYELGALNLEYDKLLSIPKGWPYLLKVLVRRLRRFALALCSRRYVEKNLSFLCAVIGDFMVIGRVKNISRRTEMKF